MLATMIFEFKISFGSFSGKKSPSVNIVQAIVAFTKNFTFSLITYKCPPLIKYLSGEVLLSGGEVVISVFW